TKRPIGSRGKRTCYSHFAVGIRYADSDFSPPPVKPFSPHRVFDERQRMLQSSRAMRLMRILLVLIGVQVAASAQTNTPEIRQLSLEDCIEIALRHNLDVQIKRYNPEIA